MDAKQAASKLDRYIRARYPIVAVISHEEKRVLAAIKSLAKQRNKAVAEWAVTTGLRGFAEIDTDSSRDPIGLFSAMIDTIGAADQPTLFVLKDFHGLLNDPVTVRYIRDLAAVIEKTKHNVIFLGPSFTIPADLDKTIVLLDWPLPDVDELSKILTSVERSLPDDVRITLNGGRETVVNALKGLTAFEAEGVLLSAIAATGELGDSVISYIIAEKAQIIRKAGVLEYYDTSLTMQDVGGLNNLKHYATRKMATFSEKAKAAGIEPAKGMLLVGVPGTGKSLSAKAIAGGRVPLLKLDMGSLMTSELGGSEKNMRSVFRTVEAIGNCVLWIDEIEKALADNDGRSDGGVKMGMLGSLLTWMQEKTCPTYIVATANNARMLKPELISRFDDVFWVDLPDASSRAEILQVHFGKRGVNFASFTSDEVYSMVAATWGFSGREIERIVKSAIETAFFEDRDVDSSDLVAAASQSVPTAVMMKEQINDLRSWAKSGQVQVAGDALEGQPELEGKRTIEM